MEKSQDFKPDRGNPAVRHYRGASENVTLVEMCSHLATERAGMGTLYLTVGASELYPNHVHAHPPASPICPSESGSRSRRVAIHLRTLQFHLSH